MTTNFKITDLLDPITLENKLNCWRVQLNKPKTHDDLSEIYTNLELCYTQNHQQNVCSCRLYKIKGNSCYLLTNFGHQKSDDRNWNNIRSIFGTATNFLVEISTIIPENQLNLSEILADDDNLSNIIPLYKKVYGSQNYQDQISELVAEKCVKAC